MVKKRELTGVERFICNTSHPYEEPWNRVGSKPVPASRYIRHFAEIVEENPDVRVVPYSRVSGREQERNNNLADEERNLLAELSTFETIETLKSFSEVQSGWVLLDPDCRELRKAARYARKHGAIIVAETTDRFLRNRRWTVKEQHHKPTEVDFERLKHSLTGDVVLATLDHPDAPPRSRQTKRGQSVKERRGGRPLKYGSHLQKIVEFRLSHWSFARIAQLLKIPQETVRRMYRTFQSTQKG